MTGLSEVLICYNNLDAEIVKGSLEKAGIDVFISKDDCGGMEPQLQMTEGIRIMVPSAHAARAISILEGFADKTANGKTSDDAPRWQCSSCGEFHEDQFTDCWNCGTARNA